MAKTTYWLASNSPRRREMLAWLDWEMRAAPANIDETRHDDEPARDYVMRVAREKAQEPIPAASADSIIIAADTIVVLDEQILGKPRDAIDAYKMLSKLRDRSHEVLTAIAVRFNGMVEQDICCSPVQMRNYSDEEIRAYIESGDPFDKAGAYAIQNPVFSPVHNFTGCFASVMGMPLCHLARTLQKCGVDHKNQFPVVCQNHLKYTCPITQRVMAGEDIG